MKEIIKPKYRWADIIDNVDELKKGRVKVRVMPEFNGIEETNLPWIYPYANKSGGCENGASHQVPEIGEKVKVVISDKYWKVIEYLNGDYVEDFYPYENFSSKVSSMSELGIQTYPQPNFIQEFKDGSFVFRNTKTGECGFYHNSGSYIIFDKDGNIFENGSGSKLKIYNTAADLKSIIKDILNVLNDLITPGNLVGNLGAPVILTTVGSDISKVTQRLTDLDNLLED